MGFKASLFIVIISDTASLHYRTYASALRKDLPLPKCVMLNSCFHAFIYLLFSLHLGRLLHALRFHSEITSSEKFFLTLPNLQSRETGEKNKTSLSYIKYCLPELTSLHWKSLFPWLSWFSFDFFLSLLDLFWCPSLSESFTILSLEHPIYFQKTLLNFNYTLFLYICCLSTPHSYKYCGITPWCFYPIHSTMRAV